MQQPHSMLIKHHRVEISPYIKYLANEACFPLFFVSMICTQKKNYW